MPRQPRAQPAQPDVEKAPKQTPATLEEKTGKPPTEEPQAASRPRQTQQTSAEGMVAEGKVPQLERLTATPIAAAELAKLNVYGRWSRIIDEVGLVPKRGWNAHHSYWFTLDADLNAFVGPLFAKYHLVVIPRVMSVERIELPGKMQLTRAHFEIEVVNADSAKGEDRFSVPWVGEGADVVDKGVYKAYTGGLKFFYMKLLQIATGDDPELFTRTDQIGQMAAEDAVRGGGQSPRPEQQQVNIRPSNRPQPEKGGHQLPATEVQIRQIRALARGMNLGVEAIAAYFDRVLGTAVYDTIVGIDEADAKVMALGEWIKKQVGTDVGKVIYEMGEEVKRRKSDEAVAEATNPYGGAPENENAAPENENAAPENDEDLLAQAAASEQ